MFTTRSLFEAVDRRKHVRARIYRAERVDMYSELWHAVDSWIQAVWSSGQTANIASFATFGWQLHREASGDVGRRPLFRFTKHFCRVAGAPDTPDLPFVTKVVEFEPVRVAIKHSQRLNKDIVAAGTVDLVECIVDAFRSGGPMSLEFSIGRLVVGEDRRPTFYFDASQRDTVLRTAPVPLSTLTLFKRVMSTPTPAAPASTLAADSLAPATGRRAIDTARSDMSRMSGHMPMSRPPAVPPLPLATGRGASRTPGVASTTSASRRTGRTAVLDAAYKRHLQLIERRVAAETKAQEKYDKEVMEFDRTLFEERHKEATRKARERAELLAQQRAMAAARREAADFDRAPGWDDMNGSILPTMGIARLEKYLSHPLPSSVNPDTIPPMELAVMKAEFAERAAKRERQQELYNRLTSQVAAQARERAETKAAEVARERAAAHQLLQQSVDESKAAWERRMATRRALLASWDRDIELQKAIKANAHKAKLEQQRWRATHAAASSKRVAAGILSPHSTPITSRSLSTPSLHAASHRSGATARSTARASLR